MALSTKPWSSIDAGDYRDAAHYCSACLMDLNESGEEKVKGKCKLPVREPGGALNRNALLAAQGALLGARGGVDAPAADKRKAARKLARLMRANDVEPSERLRQLAGSE